MAPAPAGVLGARVARSLPLIDPRSLSRRQRAGRRCAVPNCRRPFTQGRAARVGRLPDGRPVLACAQCAPAVAFEPASAGSVPYVSLCRTVGAGRRA
jgi:hypothetical protein